MQRYYPSNSHNLQVDTLLTKKRFHKSAGSIHLNYQTGSEAPENTQQNQSLKRFKHINKLNVAIDTVSDYLKLDRTLKIFRRRVDTLVTTENHVYYYDREEEKILIKMLNQLQKRVHTIHSFMLNSRTTKTINKIRSLNHLTILLDEFEDDLSLYNPISKIARLKDLKRISVISQNPERVDFFLKKIKKSCLFVGKEGGPEIGVMIPGWSGVVQQPVEIRNLFGVSEMKYMSIVCYDGLNALAQAFNLDSKNNNLMSLECLKLKLCPIFCGYSSDEEEESDVGSDLISLGDFKTIKKLELVVTPRGIFGRTPTKDVTKLLKSLTFPRHTEELSITLQEILLDEASQAEEIALSLIKLLSPLVHLKSLQLQLLYAGDVPAFFEEEFAGLFKNLVSLENLQFIVKMQNSSNSVAKVFQAGEFLNHLGAHRNLKNIELEAPVLTISGGYRRRAPGVGSLPKLKGFSLKGAGSIGTTQLDGESIVNFLANLAAVKDLERLNLDFSCCMNVSNANELVGQLEKMEKIRELKLSMIWEEYSAFEKLVNVLHGKEYLKEMTLEFPRWKAGRKYAKVFFDMFSRGCHEDIQKFSFISKTFSALRIPKKNAVEA